MNKHDQIDPAVRRTRRKAYINWAIILILSACCLYLLISKERMVASNNKLLKLKQQFIDSVKTDRLYLQADFNAASVKIDQLMSKNAGLQDSLKHNRVAINTLRTQIQSILGNQNATQTELQKAGSLIYMLNQKVQDYELDIAEFERDNATLAGENELLLKERDQAVEKSIALEMAGSVLHASNVRIEPISRLRGAREKKTDNAKKVDLLRVTFDIDENRIVESGMKQIYIRLIGPDDKVLYSDSISGTMNTIKGGEIRCSMIKEIDLVKNEPARNLVAEWHQKESYQKGFYIVELYNWGYEIGLGMMELK